MKEPKIKIYFAGPDVFYPDYPGFIVRLKDLCAQHNVFPLIPGEKEAKTPLGIYKANINLINKSEAIVANLNPFRGHEPDSGTVYEVGRAHALGKVVAGYLEDRRDQPTKLGASPPDPSGFRRLADGSFVENFGFPVNLMLAFSAKIEGSLEEAVASAVASVREKRGAI
jgi:nucleoside 2-deoxyribosyltransferase